MLYLYGKNPLKEALTQKKIRGGVLLTKYAERDPEIMGLLQSSRTSYQIVTNEEIDNKVGRDVSHQGVIASLDERDLFTPLDEVLGELSEDKNHVFIVLDSLQDPHNVGAIIRSAAAFGASAIIMGSHEQAGITGTVIKSSAGAVFSIPLVQVSNINATLLKLKESRFWIYGLTKGGDTLLTKSTFDTNVAIVIGSEGEGIHKKTLEHCDFKLSIPIAKQVESLNASNAVAVTLYEWQKQQI